MPGHFTFFAESLNQNLAIFGENETKHAIQVLRYKLGDSIDFTLGKGIYYKGKITEVSKRSFSAIVEESTAIDPKDFILGVGILKSSDRMEWLVEKAVELGVSKLIFMHSDNTERARINIEKLHKVSIAALKQCHGAQLIEISEMEFERVLDLDIQQKFIAYCDPLSQTIKPHHFNQGSIVLIGPEGDFSPKEVELAMIKQYVPISLGSQILRTETAAIACAALAL